MSVVHELWRSGEMVAFLQERPAYCNRGRWSANLNIGVGHPGLHISEMDWWPRYYFDLTVARSELEAWLKAHGVSLKDALWKEVVY